MAEILIVEDDLDLVETYSDLLESCGHSVVRISHISEATSYILDMHPDIITLDLNLPGNSNLAITAFIHTAKVISHSQIIIISGHPEIMSGQDWMDQVDLVLTKPVDNQHLLTMIGRLLSLRENDHSKGYARR